MPPERDLDLLRDIISAVSQLTMEVTNAIDETAYDLNAAAFSETTSITKDYIFDSIELNFSTAEAKTITITSADGTILWGGAVDQTASNLGYNTTKKHFLLRFGSGFNGGENITVAVTQFSNPGTMDCILKTRSGTNTLLGNPVLAPASKTQLVDGSGNVIGSSANGLKTCPEEHHTAFNEEYTADAGGDIGPITIITPAAGKKVSIHVIAMVHTDGSSGVISLDFLTSTCKALRMYPSKASSLSTSQDHTEGVADEVLTLTASGIGNGSKVFVKLQYIEE